MTNLTTNKITLYDGINSNPIAPTANSGGNITHFYQQFNSLIDKLTTELEETKAKLYQLENHRDYIHYNYYAGITKIVSFPTVVDSMTNHVTATYTTEEDLQYPDFHFKNIIDLNNLTVTVNGEAQPLSFEEEKVNENTRYGYFAEDIGTIASGSVLEFTYASNDSIDLEILMFVLPLN